MEIEAEAVAFIVASHLRIPVKTDSHFGSIGSVQNS
jgi:hypothetical protein